MTQLRLPDLNALHAFAKVVEYGGFSAAARCMGVPTSRLSRRITDLERELGVQLLQRSTRRLELTEIGRIYFGHCTALVEQAEAAQEVVEHLYAAPRGALRIAAPPTLTQLRLAPLFARFLALYPEIRLNLEPLNHDIDMIAEGFDVLIRVRIPPIPDSSLVLRPLGQSRRFLVASPALLLAQKAPTQPSDFEHLPTMAPGSGPDPGVWRLQKANEPELRIALKRIRLATSDHAMIRLAALQGIGFALLPADVCQSNLDAGDLIRVLPQWEGAPGLIHALYPARRSTLPSLRCLLDFLRAELAPE